MPRVILNVPVVRLQVKDDNPYSRLMALQRMGIVDNYEEIRAKTVAIVVRRRNDLFCVESCSAAHHVSDQYFHNMQVRSAVPF